MNRRSMVGAAAAAIPAAAIATPALAQAMPEIRWRAASSFPRVFDVLYGTFDRICARVAQLTDGKFRIQPFPAGEIVAWPAGARRRPGRHDRGRAHRQPTTTSARKPGFAPFTAMCFGLNTRQMTAWFRHGGGNELWRTSCSTANTTSTASRRRHRRADGRLVPQRDHLGGPAERGLKFRITGLAGQLFSAWVPHRR
jgi:TRAP-type mannitol/chloroaromatic compound transport system substrate-binding protein